MLVRNYETHFDMNMSTSKGDEIEGPMKMTFAYSKNGIWLMSVGEWNIQDHAPHLVQNMYLYQCKLNIFSEQGNKSLLIINQSLGKKTHTITDITGECFKSYNSVIITHFVMFVLTYYCYIGGITNASRINVRHFANVDSSIFTLNVFNNQRVIICNVKSAFVITCTSSFSFVLSIQIKGDESLVSAVLFSLPSYIITCFVIMTRQWCFGTRYKNYRRICHDDGITRLSKFWRRINSFFKKNITIAWYSIYKLTIFHFVIRF